MKKLTAAIISLLFVPAMLCAGASANSGPTYMGAAPGLGLVADKSCPVEVESERLVFDFTEEGEDTYAPSCAVTASYEMKNPTGRDISVTMAFPTLSIISVGSFFSITAGGEAVEYKTYYGDVITAETTRESGSLETSYDLSALGLDEVLSAVITECPEEPEPGTAYTITPVIADGAAFKDGMFTYDVSFTVPEGVRALYSGASRYSYEDGAVTVGDTYNTARPSPITIYSIGGADIGDISVTAKERHDSNSYLDGVTFRIDERTLPLREYINEAIDWRYWESGTLTDEQYWCLLQYGLQKTMTEFGGAAPLEEILSELNNRMRLCMAAYTVDFAAGESKNVTVTSRLSGTMRRPSGYSSVGTTYTYTYLSNPAKSWASFGALEIELIPPTDIELSSSAPELTANENGSYTASADGLPERNITFTLGREATRDELRELHKKERSRNIKSAAVLAAIAVFIIHRAVGGRKKKKT